MIQLHNSLFRNDTTSQSVVTITLVHSLAGRYDKYGPKALYFLGKPKYSQHFVTLPMEFVYLYWFKGCSKTKTPVIITFGNGCTLSRGSQRDVVYLGGPLTNSALVYEPKCGGEGGCGISANDYSCVRTWSPNKLWRSNSIFRLLLAEQFSLHNLPITSGIRRNRAAATGGKKLQFCHIYTNEPDLL